MDPLYCGYMVAAYPCTPQGPWSGGSGVVEPSDKFLHPQELRSPKTAATRTEKDGCSSQSRCSIIFGASSLGVNQVWNCCSADWVAVRVPGLVPSGNGWQRIELL